MEDIKYSCAKCGGQMERGFATDRSDLHHFTLSWVDGEPVNATAFGMKGDNLNMRGTEPLPVRGLRCARCGFLELYAI